MNTSLSKQSWLLALLSVALLLAVALDGKTIRAQSGSSARADSATESRPQRPLSGSHKKQQKASQYRLREGTHIADVPGYFQQNGEGVTFITQENHKFGGLPNLNLQRVLRMLEGIEEPENIKWIVSGTVTEFDGQNYLLIGRAVYKSNALPPAPDRVSDR